MVAVQRIAILIHGYVVIADAHGIGAFHHFIGGDGVVIQTECRRVGAPRVDQDSQIGSVGWIIVVAQRAHLIIRHQVRLVVRPTQQICRARSKTVVGTD